MISITYSQSDMPYTKNGIIPDIIMNPHAIPSRMTISQLIEGLLGKVSAIKGSISDGTAFKKINIEEIADELEQRGYQRYGKERLFNGMTGEWIDAEIFMTPVYYQRLQKFVKDEVYSISSGPTDTITRQHLDGKAKGGGLRIGEMEKDVMMAHGTVRFLMEKFLNDSDGFYIFVCRICGTRSIVNEQLGIYKCKICGDDADIVKIRTAWASNLLFHEMNAMNIGTRLGVAPYQYESTI